MTKTKITIEMELDSIVDTRLVDEIKELVHQWIWKKPSRGYLKITSLEMREVEEPCAVVGVP